MEHGHGSDRALRAWAEIDLGAVARNARRILVRNPGRRLIAVVKADAYGHGAVPVARTLAKEGAIMMGVGDSREAIELRRAGIQTPILILGAIIDGEMPAVVANDIRSTLHSESRARLLEEEARRQGRRHIVHLKVDTGMGRLGMMPEKAVEVARFVKESAHLVLEGIGTHLANNDMSDGSALNRQLEVFRRVHDEVVAAVGPLPMVHAMNSVGAWHEKITDDFTNTVRTGAALFGLQMGPPHDAYPFEPAMALKTQIIFLKDVPAGSPVGYNGRFVTERPTRLAILPIGYNDGLPWSFGPQGTVRVHEKNAPIRGSISMDYTTVDVTDIPGTAVGDTVLVFGKDGDAWIPIQELASKAQTISYAVACGVGKRVQRVYVESGQSMTAAARA